MTYNLQHVYFVSLIRQLTKCCRAQGRASNTRTAASRKPAFILTRDVNFIISSCFLVLESDCSFSPRTRDARAFWAEYSRRWRTLGAAQDLVESVSLSNAVTPPNRRPLFCCLDARSLFCLAEVRPFNFQFWNRIFTASALVIPDNILFSLTFLYLYLYAFETLSSIFYFSSV